MGLEGVTVDYVRTQYRGHFREDGYAGGEGVGPYHAASKHGMPVPTTAVQLMILLLTRRAHVQCTS
jgi:hypothetical protein